MKKYLLSILFAFATLLCFAQTEQTATVWGVKSDGVTDNTGSIQRAIDYISAHGGGTLHFYVGRYLTGAIELKSNVTIHLAEAAVLVGSTNIYDYKGAPALIWADGAENISVTGLGVIEGRGKALKESLDAQKAKGYLPADTPLPTLYSFKNCTNAVMGSEIKKLSDTAASTRYN
jgi:polygalacturonase